LAVRAAPNDGRGPFYPGEVSERTQELIDDEMRRIVDEAHEQTAKLLRENLGKLDALAEALLEDHQRGAVQRRARVMQASARGQPASVSEAIEGARQEPRRGVDGRLRYC
jgi:ATP-dependent Zn protease